MRALLLVPLALVACKETNPDFCPAHPDDPRCGGVTGDGGTDAQDAFMFDAPPDAPSCFGAGEFAVCPMGMTTGSKTLSGNIDTTMGAAGSQCASGQFWKSANTNSCFILANSVTVMDSRVTGARPLVIVANTINVIGHLDASSKVSDLTQGPHASATGTSCGTPTNPTSNTGAGGAAGASFSTSAGANGGPGDNNTNAGGTALPASTTPPGTLRAGCRGGNGGTGQGSGGAGGFGGGAVYLVAATSLSMGASGIINANGAGGGQAQKSAGGGGGGSGGMIVLWAQSFSLTAGSIVVANGGSGSTGGDQNAAGTGTAGNDPSPQNPTTPALGPTTPAGSGGNGFAKGTSANIAATAGGGGPSGEGGGGGGGGAGYIQSNMALTNAKVSPAANVVP